MIIWAIIAVYYFFKFKVITKTWAFVYTTPMLVGGMYLVCHYILEDAWWAEWILAPLCIYVGYFMMFLRQIDTLVKSVTLPLDKEDNDKLPRLNELFGNYEYRDDLIESNMSTMLDLSGGTKEILYSITTDERYFSDTVSGSLMVFEAYIHASEGNYSMAANAAKTLCKKMDIGNKDDLLWMFSWIGTDPQLSQLIFDSDGKLKDTL